MEIKEERIKRLLGTAGVIAPKILENPSELGERLKKIFGERIGLSDEEKKALVIAEIFGRNFEEGAIPKKSYRNS